MPRAGEAGDIARKVFMQEADILGIESALIEAWRAEGMLDAIDFLKVQDPLIPGGLRMLRTTRAFAAAVEYAVDKTLRSAPGYDRVLARGAVRDMAEHLQDNKLQVVAAIRQASVTETSTESTAGGDPGPRLSDKEKNLARLDDLGATARAANGGHPVEPSATCVDADVLRANQNMVDRRPSRSTGAEALQLCCRNDGRDGDDGVAYSKSKTWKHDPRTLEEVVLLLGWLCRVHIMAGMCAAGDHVKIVACDEGSGLTNDAGDPVYLMSNPRICHAKREALENFVRTTFRGEVKAALAFLKAVGDAWDESLSGDSTFTAAIVSSVLDRIRCAASF